MRYYIELKLNSATGRKVSEGRIIAQAEKTKLCYGVHTSFPDGFTRLDGDHLPPQYLEEWCKPTTEQRARKIMPELFDFLAKYGITDETEGIYHKWGVTSEVNCN